MVNSIKLKFDEQVVKTLIRMMRYLNGFFYSQKIEYLEDIRFIGNNNVYRIWGIKDHENSQGLVTFDLLDQNGYHISLNLKEPYNPLTEIEVPTEIAESYGFIKTDGKWQCGDIVVVHIEGQTLDGYEIIYIANDGALRYTVDKDGDSWHVAESRDKDDYYHIIRLSKECHSGEELENKSKIIQTKIIANEDLSIEIDKEFVIVEFSTLVTSNGSVVEDIFTTVLKFNEENSAELIRLIRKEKEKRTLCK